MGRLRLACPVFEINVISAQDLADVARNMKTYAVAWISTDPMRKLTTRVDQTNRANPIWNEKFVFRVNYDKILSLDASAIVIEIYAAAWAKDALVGSVNVLLSDLFAPWSGFADGHAGGDNNNTMRLVTLQIRRPSGRLQGFLRLGVALLDGSQRSMPLSIEVFENGNYGCEKSIDDVNAGRIGGGAGGMMLRRTHSDQTDFTTVTDDYGVKSSVVTAGVRGGGGGGTDSMVNASLCNSDIGPSASVVAAAIAQGLYNRQKTPPANKEDASLIIEGTTEGVKHRLERWKSETTPEYVKKPYKDAKSRVYSKQSGSVLTAAETMTSSQGRWRRKRRVKQQRRMDDDDGRRKKGLFSCFGNVFGCEISITCGGGGDGGSSRKKYSTNKVANLSAADETFSQSVA